VITPVGSSEEQREISASSKDRAEYKEAFALFDKKGTGAIPREDLGDLLRALGQNPTQAEVADIVSKAPREGKVPLYFLGTPAAQPVNDSWHLQWTIRAFCRF
jgi:Ca2+-binding EF-hand superfamily protein